MYIYDESYNSVYIEHITSPIQATHYWALDLIIKDFTLVPLLILEEYTAPALLLDINGFKLKIPTNWKILIYDEGTSYLDAIDVYELTTNKFSILEYGPSHFSCGGISLKVLDYTPSTQIVAPAMNKHHMMCYPISKTSWIVITPHNIYNKYIRYMAVGDIT